MPIDTSTYLNWASAHLNSAAFLDPKDDTGSLQDVSTRMSKVSQFFKRGAVHDLQKEMRADFQRALTRSFGSSIAQEVMKSTGKILTGKVITDAIQTAEIKATSSQLKPLLDRSVNLASGPDLDLDPMVGDRPTSARLVSDRMALLQREAATLLGTFAIGDSELADMEAQCDFLTDQLEMVKQDLDTLSRCAEISNEEAQQLRTLCASLKDAIDQHLADITDANANRPMSDAGVNRFRDTWISIFETACTALKDHPKVANNPNAIRCLDELAGKVKQEFMAGFKPDKKCIDKLSQRLCDELKSACGNLVLSVVKESECKKALQAAYEDVLNHREWKNIDKQFTGALGGQTLNLASSIHPGKHVKGVGETYTEGCNGYMCHSAGEKKHAVNLAVSTFSVNGKQVFAGVRHGVHSAWEVKDKQERFTANQRRAEETVKAAFSAFLDKHPGLSPQDVIELPMTSVSLLTPDIGRHIFCGAKEDERLLLSEQTAAWDAVNGKTLEVKIGDQTFKVKPQIATFNFGVNGGAVGKAKVVTLGDWKKNDAINLKGFLALESQIEAFLNRPGVSDREKKAVNTLYRQLSDIMIAGKERKDDHDAYKAAARVAVLSSLIDGVPCWNCKSGKDRTGQLDVECKFLATLVERGEEIPEPGAELTTEQKNLFRTIALQSGNHEMQEYNTGIGGFKTPGVKSVVERLGGADARTFHAGGADYVAV